MKSSNDSARTLARAAAVPDLDALRTELATVLSQAGGIRERQTRSHNTRVCKWENQSEDYRKWDEDQEDGVAKPFNGAPDQRVPVVDIVARERAALYTEALMSGEIQAKPIGSLEQGANAARMTNVLRWLRENRLEEFEDEAELLHNYIETDDPGVAVIKICWHREPALEMRELSLEEVATELLRTRGIDVPDLQQLPPAAAQQAIGAIMDLEDMIFNAEREDEAIEALGLVFPTVNRRGLLKRALKELRRDRATQLPLAYVKENRPSIAALRYMEDIFFPKDLDNLQKARVIFEREWVSETDLRARVHAEGYDESWVEEVLDAGPGVGSSEPWKIDLAWTGLATQGNSTGDAETDKLYEVWHAYSRAGDGYGIPGVYRTVFSEKVKAASGAHELLDYPDGEYPFVLFRAERVARGVENVRGTPERAGSLQSDIKLQRDCRGAHTMISTIPPVRVTQRRGGLEAVLGPMVEVPVRDQTDVTWMQPPQFPAASIEMEKATWNDLNQYFGRVVPGVTTPQLAEALLQRDVNRQLGRWRKVWDKIQELQQAYGDPVEMQLVAGGPMMRYTREEIRGKFSTLLTFNVRDLNMEFVISRNQAIAAALQQDIAGIADRTVIVRASLRAIDPNMAEQALRDPQVVTQKEIEDERLAVNMLANGIEAPLRQTGINAQLRLKTLQDTVMGSAILARRFHQPASPDDKYFRTLVENRSKNFEFLVQQYGPGAGDNPAVGRQGTRPLQQGAGTANMPPA